MSDSLMSKEDFDVAKWRKPATRGELMLTVTQVRGAMLVLAEMALKAADGDSEATRALAQRYFTELEKMDDVFVKLVGKE